MLEQMTLARIIVSNLVLNIFTRQIFRLVVGYLFFQNKANFKGTTKEEQFKDVSAKVGTIFTF